MTSNRVDSCLLNFIDIIDNGIDSRNIRLWPVRARKFPIYYQIIIYISMDFSILPGNIAVPAFLQCDRLQFSPEQYVYKRALDFYDRKNQ